MLPHLELLLRVPNSSNNIFGRLRLWQSIISTYGFCENRSTRSHMVFNFNRES